MSDVGQDKFQPASIMEGALARRLRARPAIMKRGLSVSLGKTGGVIVARGQEIVGVWCWTGDFFRFSQSIDGPVEFEANTLMCASFYTSHLFLE